MTSHTRRSRRLLLAIAALLTAATLTVPTSSGADTSWGPSVPGEFIVELSVGTNPATVNRAVSGVAAPQRLHSTSQLYRFRLAPTTDAAAGVAAIQGQNGVVDADPNVIADIAEFYGGRRLFWTDHEPPVTTAPASSYRVNQSALANAGLPVRGSTGRGIVVAVLDTGVDTTHTAFANRIAPGGYDFVDRDATPAEVADGRDDNANGLVDEAFGHGTYVAGIVRLVAPAARILPIRIIDSDGRTDSWRILQGVHRAQQRGARVVNLSLGGTELGGIVERDLESKAEAGMIIVAAAGNENTEELRYPAANPGVIGVTAIDGATGAKATFANHGSWIGLAAPGVRVVSAYPGGRYAVWGGTSASAPVVAGTAALVAQIMGAQAATDDVVDRMTSTAVADALPNVSAYGAIRAQAAVDRAITG